MDYASLAHQILEHVRALPDEDQRRVLDFVCSLGIPRTGVPGAELLPFAGTIDKRELKCMSQAIEDGCEQVE